MKNLTRNPWFWVATVVIVLLIVWVWYSTIWHKSALFVFTPASPTPTHSPSHIATPAATPTPSANQSAGSAACTYAELSFKAGQSSGAAGTSYTPMVFTNKSSVTCTLQGYPTVTLVESTGGQIGSSAAHDTSKTASLVTLAPSASASAIVATHNPGAYPSGACSAQSAQVKVLVPGQSQAFMTPFNAYICGSWTVAPIAAGSM